MTIYDAQGNEFLKVTPDDTSYRHREVMGEDALTLKFSSPVHVELPVGAWCEFGGTRYTLYRPEALTMHHSRDFEYTVTMEAEQWLAGIWMFRDLTDGRVSFSLTAKPSEHLELLVANLNARAGEGHWEAGDCVDAAEACIGYDYVRCSEALGLMADAFGTEWEFEEGTGEDGETHRTVSLHRVEHDRSDPIALSYGRGNGFRPDVGRANSSDDPPVEALYAQGGSDNISAGRYPQDIHGEDEYPEGVERPTSRSALLLPPGRRIGYDGSVFFYEDASGSWNPDGTGVYGREMRKYAADAQGYSVARLREDGDGEGDDAVSLGAEDSLDCSEIYPKRVGTVTSVQDVDGGTDDEGNSVNFHDFCDASLVGEELDYNDYLIDGETMTVIFQSGMLAGKEFEVSKYRPEDGGFELVSQVIDGITMPQDEGEPFGIAVGDTYAVFGCMLPNEYICNDADHSGAEWDMLRECVRRLRDVEDEHPYITGKVDGILFRDRWGEVGPRVRPGGFVQFSDEQFEQDGLLIRIVGVKDYVNSPQSPELELSNETVSAGLTNKFLKVRGVQVSDAVAVTDTVGFVRGQVRNATVQVRDLVQYTDDLGVEIGYIGDIVNGDDDDPDDGGLVGKVGDLDGKVGGIEVTVGDLSADLNGGTRSDGMYTEGLRQRVTSLASSVTSLDQSVTKLDSAVSALDETVSGDEGIIAAINYLSGKMEEMAVAIEKAGGGTIDITPPVITSPEGNL